LTIIPISDNSVSDLYIFNVLTYRPKYKIRVGLTFLHGYRSINLSNITTCTYNINKAFIQLSVVNNC